VRVGPRDCGGEGGWGAAAAASPLRRPRGVARCLWLTHVAPAPRCSAVSTPTSTPPSSGRVGGGEELKSVWCFAVAMRSSPGARRTQLTCRRSPLAPPHRPHRQGARPPDAQGGRQGRPGPGDAAVQGPVAAGAGAPRGARPPVDSQARARRETGDHGQGAARGCAGGTATVQGAARERVGEGVGAARRGRPAGP
jgi:hypothetical protein